MQHNYIIPRMALSQQEMSAVKEQVNTEAHPLTRDIFPVLSRHLVMTRGELTLHLSNCSH